MATTIGPLFSATARGTFATQLTYRHTRGNSSCRKRTDPNNHLSDQQAAHHQFMKWCAHNWRTLDPTNKNLWLAFLNQDAPSPYFAYTTYELANWRAGNAPKRRCWYHVQFTMPATTITALTTPGGIMITAQNGPPPDNAAYHFVFRDTTAGFTPGPHNLLRFKKLTFDNEIFAFTDHPTLAATYYYKSRLLDPCGNWNSTTATCSATWPP
jgi:hypothetical protein